MGCGARSIAARVVLGLGAVPDEAVERFIAERLGARPRLLGGQVLQGALGDDLTDEINTGGGGSFFGFVLFRHQRNDAPWPGLRHTKICLLFRATQRLKSPLLNDELAKADKRLLSLDTYRGLVLLLLVLTFKPAGLFGKTAIKKV